MLWFTSEAAVALVIIVVLIADAWLKATGHTTISQWLRLHPREFWVPLFVILALLAELIVHLFIVWWL